MLETISGVVSGIGSYFDLGGSQPTPREEETSSAEQSSLGGRLLASILPLPLLMLLSLARCGPAESQPQDAGEDADGDGDIDNGDGDMDADDGTPVCRRIGPEVRITDDAEDSLIGSLVWAGSEYGMVWGGSNGIHFRRISEGGVPTGSEVHIATMGADTSGSYPSLVWTGREYGGVIWSAFHDDSYEISFMRISAAGDPIGLEVHITDPDGRASMSPSLAWTGREYGLVWTDYRDLNFELYFTRISADGDRVGSEIRITMNEERHSEYPSLVWSGSEYGEYGVSWVRRGGETPDICFRRIATDGEPLGTGCQPLDGGGDWLGHPSLIWTGSGYGAIWAESSRGPSDISPGLYFTRISAYEGGSSGPRILVTTDDSLVAEGPSIVWTGTEYGVAWTDHRHGIYNSEIYFGRISETGDRIDSDARITDDDGSNSGGAALVWSGSEYGVAWQDRRDGNEEIYFARIGCD